MHVSGTGRSDRAWGGTKTLVRVLAALSVVIALVAMGPVLFGLALASADSSGADNTWLIVLFFWVLIGWPVAAATAVAGAALVGRWPRPAAAMLGAAGVALGVPFVIPGLPAGAAAIIAYLSSPSLESATGEMLRLPHVARAVGIGVAVLIAAVALASALPVIIFRVHDYFAGETAPSAQVPTPQTYTTAEEAARAFALELEPPFLGDCPAAASRGTCVASKTIGDREATFRLCEATTDYCVQLELGRKYEDWVVLEVGKDIDGAKP
jgi:hypothetical protein